ncbi:MAG: hypothetical protein M4579_007238, partial [Chaenotheca gracillima]
PRYQPFQPPHQPFQPPHQPFQPFHGYTGVNRYYRGYGNYGSFNQKQVQNVNPQPPPRRQLQITAGNAGPAPTRGNYNFKGTEAAAYTGEPAEDQDQAAADNGEPSGETKENSYDEQAAYQAYEQSFYQNAYWGAQETDPANNNQENPNKPKTPGPEDLIDEINYITI